jgi:hypothetical protein
MSLLSSLLRFTITLQAPTGAPDKWGKYTYGAAESYAAFISLKKRRVIGFDGREAFSNTQLFLDGDVTVEPTYKITLPSGMTPQSPPIVGVEKPAGPGVVHHAVLHLGGRCSRQLA